MKNRMAQIGQGSHGTKNGLCELLLAGASCQTIKRVCLSEEFPLFDGRAWGLSHGDERIVRDWGFCG
jgi:hypothetical protein